MSSRAASGIAWAVCGLTLALIACAVALSVPNRYDLSQINFLIAVASAALVGGLISSRERTNPVGWLILGHALCFALGEFGRQYAVYGVRTEPGSLPFARAMIWPTYWVWYPGLMSMVAFLPLYFPDGRLLSARWRWVVRTSVLLSVLATGAAMIRPGDNEAAGIPNPLGVEALTESSQVVSALLEIILSAAWPLLGAASAASLVVRFRRSRGEERQQLKWVAYAMVLLVSFNALSQLVPAAPLPFAVAELLFVVTLESLWVAIAVAILRHRLYEIDVVINRTLVYGSLTAALVAVYVGSVVLLQGVFRALTGQESRLAIVASTLVIAALFGPLRRRVQGFIDRRFYRKKYDAKRTLEAFGTRLRDEVDLGALTDDMVGVVRETVQPTHASLWLREAADRKPGAGG